MPQGSDFIQKQVKKERFERRDLEQVYEELDELRMRVRELEELVSTMADKLKVKATNWHYWR